MPRLLAIAAVIVALAAGASHAHGQKATERYIPVGQSPGLSGKVTYIGVIAAADAGTRTITMTRDGERYAFSVTGETRIWLDRSRMKLTTLDGGFADLQRGRRVELNPAAAARNAAAEWIKVEITAADGPAR